MVSIMKYPKLPPLILKSGHSNYYLFTYKNIWDPLKKRSRRTESRKVGVIISGNKEGRIKWNDEFLKQKPELANFVCERKGKEYVFTPLGENGLTLTQALSVKTLHAGATWALDRIVQASPLGGALREAFPRFNDCRKILSLAYFIILNADNNVSRYASFAETTRLPWQRPLSSSALSRLFDRVGEERIEVFFRAMHRAWLEEKQAGGKGRRIVLALDSTSISSYSKKLANVEYGFNKDEDYLPQINLLLLVGQETGLPVYYRYYDGNVPDVSTVRRVIADNARLKLENVMLVSDKGYCSTNNINDCLRNGVSFIFNMRCEAKGSLAQELIEQSRSALEDLNRRDWFTRTACVTQELEWRFDPYPIEGKKARNDERRKLYWHIFFDRRCTEEASETLLERLDTVRRKLDQGKALEDNETTLLEKFFTQADDGRYCVVNSKVQQYLAFKGYRVLVSDTEKDTRKAWIAYKERWIVEDAFKTLKYRLGCSRNRTSRNGTLAGKIFVQFLATAISMMVRCRIKQYAFNANKNQKINVVYESDGAILALLNNVQLIRFNEGNYFGEVAGKRRRYFEALGVPVPVAGAQLSEDYDGEEDIDDQEELQSDLVV